MKNIIPAILFILTFLPALAFAQEDNKNSTVLPVVKIKVVVCDKNDRLCMPLYVLKPKSDILINILTQYESAEGTKSLKIYSVDASTEQKTMLLNVPGTNIEYVNENTKALLYIPESMANSKLNLLIELKIKQKGSIALFKELMQFSVEQ